MAYRSRGRPINPIEALYSAWRGPARARAIDILRAQHGNLPRWLASLDRLPEIESDKVSLGATVSARTHGICESSRRQLDCALRDLVPWRKGPFHLFGIDIDSEWRSHLKWARIAPHIDLEGRRVLDAGCGNGYYGWRMLEAGARSVTGVDPSVLVTLQHAAISYYVDRGGARNTVFPLRLEDLEPAEAFDVVFSMGVVYHRRDPASHLRDLAKHAHDRTTLVLESLVVDDASLEPRERYARMRNVWLVPDIATLRSWLADAGFTRAEVVDVSATTTREQRRTAWMPFDSLAAALDPSDPDRTVEGYPAPKRAFMIANRT